MTTNFNAIQDTCGGEFYAILGHMSKSDQSVKDRLLHATTGVIPRIIDLQSERFNDLTPYHAAELLKPHGIDADFALKARQILGDRISDKLNGKSKGGPSTVHVVARGANGGTILRLVSSGDSWQLQAVGEQRQAWTRVKGNVDHKAEYDRKFDKCVANAQKQIERWLAFEEERTDPKAEEKTLSSVVALLNKCLDKEYPIINNYRTLNLMGPGAITCKGIAIHGEHFINMFSVVAHFRPDLVGLLQSEAVTG